MNGQHPFKGTLSRFMRGLRPTPDPRLCPTLCAWWRKWCSAEGDAECRGRRRLTHKSHETSGVDVPAWSARTEGRSSARPTGICDDTARATGKRLRLDKRAFPRALCCCDWGWAGARVLHTYMR